MRPNIRVEIQNNLAESMDVDENEEGEISDNEDVTKIKPIEFDQNTPNKDLKAKLNFTTGIDILDKKEQEKRQERARRFRLNPEEIKNFSDDDLQLLHMSLGITQINQQNVRFEAIHVRGIKGATPLDILEYFVEYAPVSIEFVCEETCNVVWLDKISATRALHFASKAVRGMPVRDDSSYFGILQDSEEALVVNKNREIELQDDEEMTVYSKKFNDVNSVDISEITATIPPGYWRLGDKQLDKKCLLMRFSLRTDKQPYKTEHFSKYYKVQGKKKQGIFDRNKELFSKSSQKNPWASLAESWDEDAKFRERDYTKEDQQKIEIKNPSLRVRLGEKRKNVVDESKDLVKDDEEVEEKPVKKTKIPRMRMYADEEEEKIKRKKMLKRLDQQFKQIEENRGDLRKVLNMTTRNPVKSEPEPEPEVFDLGSRLKNRRKMVFEIKTEMDKIQKPAKQDIRSRLSKAGERSERESERDRRRRRSSERHARSRVVEDEDDDFRSRFDDKKPKSKVAVVIRTQKRPTVASAVASTGFLRSNLSQESSESDSESEKSSSSSESSSEDDDEDEAEAHKSILLKRPGFSHLSEKLSTNKSPLKIEISNDHFRKNF